MKIASFVAVIVLGFVLARKGNLPRGFTDALSQIVFKIILPCAIFHAFCTNTFDVSLLMLTALVFAFTFVPWLIGTLLVWREEHERRVPMMMNVCGLDLGCFCLPFVQALFPPYAMLRS